MEQEMVSLVTSIYSMQYT